MRICTLCMYRINYSIRLFPFAAVWFYGRISAFLLSGRAVNAGPCGWCYWFMSGIISLDAKIAIQTGRGGDFSTDADRNPYRPRVSCHLETINVTADSPFRCVACRYYLSPAALQRRSDAGFKFKLPLPPHIPAVTLSSANNSEGNCLPYIAVHTVPSSGLCSLWRLNPRLFFSMVENRSWRLFYKSA